MGEEVYLDMDVFLLKVHAFRLLILTIPEPFNKLADTCKIFTTKENILQVLIITTCFC